MEYVNLGSSGLKVSRICLGMMTYGTAKWRPWVIEEDATRPIVQRAVEQGINFFDTADMYSAGVSEALTGKFLREFAHRDQVVIATKLFFPVDLNHDATSDASAQAQPNTSGLSRKRIFQAVDESLTRLGTDYIDLYQIHRWDPQTPIEETMEALHDIVKAGKVRYIGASSMWAWQFAKAQHIAEARGWTRFISMQNHYNLVYREEEREMIPLCRDMGVALIPWSPLARGFLVGNRGPGDDKDGPTLRAKTDNYAQTLYYQENDFAVVDRVTRLADKRGVTNARIAYAWILHQKGVTAPIVGASQVKYIDDAVAAAQLALTPEEIDYLNEPYRPHPVQGHS